MVWQVARESSRAYMKFEHQISEGNYRTYGLRQKDSIIFIVQR